MGLRTMVKVKGQKRQRKQAKVAPSGVGKKKAGKARRKSGGSDVLTGYRLALTSPFSEGAVGARVPDQFTGHTIGHTLKFQLSIGTDAGGASDVVIFPNVACPAISTRGNIVGGSTLTWSDGSTVGNGVYTINTADVSAKMSVYRIVGMGVKVETLTSLTNTGGRVNASTIPIASWLKIKNFTVGSQPVATNSNGTPSNTLKAWSIPADSNGKVDTTQMCKMTDTVTYSGNDVAMRPVIITPKQCSPSALDFRQSQDTVVGFDVEDAVVSGNVWGGDASYLRLDGFESVILTATGMPANTTCFNVEVIYHLEGVPQYATGGTILSSKGAASPVGILGMYRVIEEAAKAPMVRRAIVDGANIVHPLLGKFAQLLM